MSRPQRQTLRTRGGLLVGILAAGSAITWSLMQHPGGSPAARPDLPAEITAKAATWTGRCTAVHDGDTLTVEHSGRRINVRLAGVDAPELAQPGGEPARVFTANYALAHDLLMTTQTRDHYGRIVADVRRDNLVSLPRALVESGNAWHYREYPGPDPAMPQAEAEARVSKRGLWARPDPMPPWRWRHRKP